MKKVILAPNPYRDKNFQTVREAMRILTQNGMDVKICLPFEIDRSYDLPKDLHFSRLDKEISTASAVVCFGGDGTILHMAKAATRHGVPILGVNIGTMGFMAELESTELDKLACLAKGEYSFDNRMMLDVTVQWDRDIVFHDICLNDVVVTKGAVARIVHLSVECDGVQAMECSGDGIIVATPTGSTAYSMSAGGPVADPRVACLCVTPICPHSLGARPLIFPDSATLEIRNICQREKMLYLTVDGRTNCELYRGETVRITRSPLLTRLVRLKTCGFYDRLRVKMSEHN